MEKFLSESELNVIRGKVMIGMATRDEMLSVFEHLDSIEYVLDDPDYPMFVEGWRQIFGLPE